jgi:hypothetical protein
VLIIKYLLMISVENFYWVLYEQLLRPTGMHANFFYPFGTTGLENIVEQEYSRPDTFHQPLCARVMLPVHLAFFYDQEPLYTSTADQACVFGLGTKWFKSLRILANSEHSAEKQQLLKEHSAVDWYYFYHGFAALDWFRDARYLKDNYSIRHAYLSLNHLVTGDRSYRMALTARLAARDLLKLGLVSFHSQPGTCQTEIHNSSSKLSTLDRLLIKNNLSTIDSGLRVDHYTGRSDFSAQFGHFEYKLLQSCFLHVVNETVFYHNKLHLTEKVFKPIVARRPFVLAAAPGNLAYLRSYGFRTFDQWIDETYDTETNPTKRLNMIADQVERISLLPQAQRDAMHQDMQQVLQHNYHHFFGEFRNIITRELVVNFEKCVRIHNNGRVDQRVVNLIDYDQACAALLA